MTLDFRKLALETLDRALAVRGVKRQQLLDRVLWLHHLAQESQNSRPGADIDLTEWADAVDPLKGCVVERLQPTDR